MPTPLVPCLYTTVKNISGKTLSFGFLGIHGKSLQPDEEYSEFGDLTAKLQGRAQTRARAALERALEGSVAHPATLRIKQSAAVVLYDDTLGAPQVVDLDAGALGVADPCWGADY